MTSKYSPADLERRWKQGKLTVAQMIGQFLVYKIGEYDFSYFDYKNLDRLTSIL